MSTKKETMKDDVALIQKLKTKMEKDIAKILKNFELETGLKPGKVLHRRASTLHRFDYIAYIEVNI